MNEKTGGDSADAETETQVDNPMEPTTAADGGNTDDSSRPLAEGLDSHVKRGEQQATSRAESKPCACDGRPRGNDVHGLRGHEVHSLLQPVPTQNDAKFRTFQRSNTEGTCT